MAFLDLNLSISNDTVPIKFMINGTISILVSLISRSLMATSLGVSRMETIRISQIIRLARASSHVSAFSCRKKIP